jgi:hypothetical protein
MAWPRKGTRKLVIDQAEWLCHYDAHCALCSGDCVTVGRRGQPHYLFLDTFSYYFQHTPRHIVDSIRWALVAGWSPKSGPDRGITVTEDGFAWLPPGHRHCADSLQRPSDSW